jgi:hypothetical protein
LGLRLDAEEEYLIRNKEMMKQSVAILALGPNVRIEIIDQIYA